MSNDDNVVNLTASGILGVVSGEASATPEKPKALTSEMLEENGGLIRIYASALGQNPVRLDVLEALQAADPTANEQQRDITPDASIKGLEACGLSAKIVDVPDIDETQYPAIAIMDNGQYVLVYYKEDDTLYVYDDDAPNHHLPVPCAEFLAHYSGKLIKARHTLEQLKDTHLNQAK